MEEKRGWYFTMATLFIRSGWEGGAQNMEGGVAWNLSLWQGLPEFPSLPLAWGGEDLQHARDS